MKYAPFFFFLAVLFSGCFLAEPKKMDVVVPKDTEPAHQFTGDSLTTFLLDGNREGKLFYYEGNFSSVTVISAFESDTAAAFQHYLQQTDSLKQVFLIKWGGDAKYNDIIDLIDQLKINKRKKYALEKISRDELLALKKITGAHYPELDQ